MSDMSPDPATIVPPVVTAKEFKPYKSLIIIISFVTLAVVLGIILFLILQGRTVRISDADTLTSTSSVQSQTVGISDTSAPTSTSSGGKKISLTLYMPKSPASLETDNMGNLQLGELMRTTDRVDVATFLIEQLILGPSVAEAAAGFYVPRADENASTDGIVLEGASNCNGKDFTLGIKNKVATLKFCKQITGIGSFADGLILESLKRNINQFDTVDKVIVLDNNGDCLFDMSGMNVCLD